MGSRTAIASHRALARFTTRVSDLLRELLNQLSLLPHLCNSGRQRRLRGSRISAASANL